MKYMLFGMIGCIILYIISAAKRALGRMRYLHLCRERFNELCGQGLSEREALVTISKERHPELDDRIHQEIADKCPDVSRLVMFIYNVLDFRTVLQWGYVRKLSNEKAEALIENTTITERGRMNTNIGAVREQLQHK
jgi:hypothetical protein